MRHTAIKHMCTHIRGYTETDWKTHTLTYVPEFAAKCEVCRVCMELVGSPPEFSASVLGTTSNASPNFRMAYWSRPCTSSANRDSLREGIRGKGFSGVSLVEGKNA